MKKISIIVLENCTSIAPVGAMELLRKANEIHKNLHQLDSDVISVELVGVNSKKVLTSGDFEVKCHRKISEVTQTDILLIPAMEFDIEEKMAANQAIIDHLVRLHKSGSEIGSFCTGAFLLAESGLMKGKTMTTHWALADLLQKNYPDIQVKSDKIMVDQGSVYSCGGATSFMNLVLFIVEKICGHDTAVMTSKMLLIDFIKTPQSGYAIFNVQKNHGDKNILKAQTILEDQSNWSLTVNELANQVNLSLRNFTRRFKKATAMTPTEYLQRLKIEEAKQQLRNSLESFETITFGLGYNDVNTFRQLFKRMAGINPSEYRKKYRHVS